MGTPTYTPLAEITLGSSAASDCIPFIGYIDKGTGYGIKKLAGKNYKAHRLAYILAFGDIDRKTHIDHVCHNDALANGTCQGGVCEHRKCVNVEHLRAVSASDNFRAGANGLDSKKFCDNGHELSIVGIYVHKGARTCHECRKINGRKATKRWEEKMKAMAN